MFFMVRGSLPVAQQTPAPPGAIDDQQDDSPGVPAARPVALRAAQAQRAAQAARAARGSTAEQLAIDSRQDVSSPPGRIRDLIAINQDPSSAQLFPQNKGQISATQPYSAFGNLPLLPPAPPANAAATYADIDPLFGGLPGVTMDHIQEAFDQIDFDGNGFIGASELRYLLTAMGERPKDAEIDEMLRLFDDDGNGQVDWEEFQQLFFQGTPVLPQMLSMEPGEQIMGGSPREPGSPGGRSSASSDGGSPTSRKSRGESEPPSPKQVNMMMNAAHGFLHAFNKTKREKHPKQHLPKAKSAAAGMIRARPGTPTKPLPVSPRSVKRERQSFSPAVKGKGMLKGKGAPGKGPMHTTGIDPGSRW